MSETKVSIQGPHAGLMISMSETGINLSHYRLASAFFTLAALLSSIMRNVTFLVAIHSATRMLTGNVAFPLDRGCCTQLIPENKSMLMEWKRGSGVSKKRDSMGWPRL